MNTLIRRAAPGLALAGVTLSTVWLFDPALQADAEPSAGAPAQDASSSADGATDAGSDSSGTDTGTSTDPGTGTDADTDAGTDTDAAAGSGQAPAPSDCTTAETLTGEPAATQWGPVQVEMAVADDGTICSVQAVAYPDNDRKSALINSYAIPELNAMAMSEGTAFHSISGATYTSEAYRESMQSILDRL